MKLDEQDSCFLRMILSSNLIVVYENSSGKSLKIIPKENLTYGDLQSLFQIFLDMRRADLGGLK